MREWCGSMAEFNPTSIASLLSWHNATNEASISLNGSDEILEIADLSGNGLDLDDIKDSTNRLTVEPAIINGLPAFKNQTSNCGIVWSATGINARVIICVWKWYNKSSYDHAFASAGYYHGNSSAGLGSPVFQGLGSRFGFDAVLRLNGEDKGTNGTQLKCSGTEQLFALLINAGDSSNDHFQGIGYPTTSLGHRAPGIYYGELITLEAGYTTDEIEEVEGYLAHKWGVEGDLPAAHPYKAAPPTSPPALTSPAGVSSGFSTIDGTVDTSEGSGTLYFAATESATPPTVAEIQAGSGFADSGSQSVSASGEQTVTFDGLEDNTAYYLHYQQKDSSGDDSEVVTSAAVTTDEATGPSITSQPASVSGLVGEAASISVTATPASGSLGYQWYDAADNSPLAGETGSTIDVVFGPTVKTYYVIVTDSIGSVQSSNATVTGITSFGITAQPQSQSILDGESVALTVGAGGGVSPLSYQWYENEVLMSGETSSTLTFTVATADDQSGYYCEVTDSDSSVIESAEAVLTVYEALAVSTQPSAASVDASDEAVFSAAASGSGAIRAQWFGPAGDITGVISAPGGSTSVRFEAYPSSAGDYYAVFTDGFGQSVQTSSAALTVTVAAPVILLQPQDVNQSARSAYTLEVSASGYGGLLYRWYLDGVEIPGENRSKITVPPGVEASEAYVTVTNPGGTVQSDNATITLYDVGLVNDTTFKPPHPGPYTYAPTRYTVRDFASMVAAVEGQHKEVDDYVFSGRRFTRRDKLLNPKGS